MKIDLSRMNFNTLELVFDDGVKITIDQYHSTKEGSGILVKADNGNYCSLQNLTIPIEKKFLNPENKYGFKLVRGEMEVKKNLPI